MIAWLRRWLTPPVFEDEEKNRAAGLAHRIALAVLLLPLLALLSVLFAAPTEIGITLAVFGFFFILSLVMLYLVNRGRLDVAGWLLTAMFYMAITWSVFSYRGVRDLTVTGYFVAVILAILLIGGRAALGVALVSAVTIVVAYLAEVNGILAVNLEAVTPPFQLLALLLVLGFTASLVRFTVQSNAYAFGQLRQTARALRGANRELESSRDALANRAIELERRSAYLHASSQVAGAVASILDVEPLLSRVVELIHDRFRLYYVGIFLLDEAREWAVLRAGSGPAGQAMLARGHRIRVGEGMIGWSVLHGEARVAQETDADAVWLTTPELPETRAEAALPLQSRGRILGAITVQATQAGAFDEVALPVLRGLADQVALALDNARLYAESQTALEAERRAYGEVSGWAWTEMVRSGGELGYACRQSGAIVPVEGSWRPEMRRASESGQLVGGGDGSLALPIKIRDQVIGVVHLRKRETEREWTDDEVDVMQSLASQLEAALESARLYQDTQRREAKERLVGQVTTRMRETLDMETVLKSAADEMRAALGLERLVVRLGTPEPDGQPQA